MLYTYILTSDGRKIGTEEGFRGIFDITEGPNDEIIIKGNDNSYKPKEFTFSLDQKNSEETQEKNLLSNDEINEIILREGLKSLNAIQSITIGGKEYFHGIIKGGTHMLFGRDGGAFGGPYSFKAINMDIHGTNDEGDIFIEVDRGRGWEYYYPKLKGGGDKFGE